MILTIGTAVDLINTQTRVVATSTCKNKNIFFMILIIDVWHHLLFFLTIPKRLDVL